VTVISPRANNQKLVRDLLPRKPSWEAHGKQRNDFTPFSAAVVVEEQPACFVEPRNAITRL
jgi:hypothetical protein